MSRGTAVTIFWTGLLLVVASLWLGWMAGIIYEENRARPDIVTLEVTEQVVVRAPPTPEFPVWCPLCSCDPAWHSVNVQRAWQRFDSASEKMGRKVDMLMVDALNCDTAVRGWASATSHWEAACRGDRNACR